MKTISALSTLILLLLLAVQPAGAQTTIDRLARLQVDLWPDFDQPAVLVLLTAELPTNTPLPATVAFRLPAESGGPSAVAYIAPDGGMFNAPYETSDAGEMTLVSVETSESVVRVEYYFPYTRAGDTVRFSYRWLGGLSIDEMSVLLQRPAQATSVSTPPAFQDVGVLSSSGGLRNYEWAVGAVGPDDSPSAEISYVSPSTVAPSEPTVTVDEQETSLAPIVGAAVGGLLVGVIIGWLLGTRRATSRRVVRRQTAPKATRCRDCGAHLRADDAFCRQCGTKAR